MWVTRKRRSAEERLLPVVQSVAASTGISVPTVETTLWGGPHVGRTRAGRYTLSFPRRLALHASPLELRGYVGHELQHIAQGDTDPGTLPRTLAAAALMFGPPAVFVFLPARALGPDRVWLVGLLQLCLAAAVIPFLRLAFGLLHRRSDGLSQPVVELRDDLAVGRVVGMAAVIAALVRTQRKEQQWIRAKCAAAGSWLVPTAVTHPLTRVRVEVVTADTEVEDPWTLRSGL